MSEAITGYMAIYKIFDAAATPTPIFKEISEVFEINMGEEAADKIDITHLQSPGRMREFTAGFIDPGEASFQINWIPGDTTDLFLRALKESGDKVEHQIEFPNGVTVTFDGVILSYAKSAVTIDDKLTATITVARSGGEVWDDTPGP